MATITKSYLENKPSEDVVRIKGGNLTLDATVVTGKEGEYFVSIIPSLMISGYGSTMQDAMDALDENMETFCEDFMKLNSEERKSELIKLGFAQVPYHTKNFSKLYVDENGLLQGLEIGSIKKNKQYKITC